MRKKLLITFIGIFAVVAVGAGIIFLNQNMPGLNEQSAEKNNQQDTAVEEYAPAVVLNETIDSTDIPDEPVENGKAQEAAVDQYEGLTITEIAFTDAEQEQYRKDLLDPNVSKAVTIAYAVRDINVYRQMDTSSDVICVIKKDDPVRYYGDLNDWNVIDINGDNGYIEKETITFFPPGTEIAKGEEDYKGPEITNSNNQPANDNTSANGNTDNNDPTENADSANDQPSAETPVTQTPEANEPVNNTPIQEQPAGNNDTYAGLDPEVAEWFEKNGDPSIDGTEWGVLPSGTMSTVGEGDYDHRWDNIHFE